MKNIEEFLKEATQNETLKKEVELLESKYAKEGMSDEVKSDFIGLASKYEYPITIDELNDFYSVDKTDGQVDQVTANDTSYPDWMAKLPNSRSLKDLCIPGTHDTATWKMSPSAKCQWRNIQEQLNDGIRFLDVRVGYNSELYHGDFACGVNLRDIISACVNHLNHHRTEAILVMLSSEGVDYGNAKFREWIEPAFRGYENYWYFSNSIPTVGQVRGKMVLVNGSNTGKAGLDLNSFHRQNDWDPGNWKQKWEKRAQLKVDLILNFIEESRHNNSNCMLMNNWNKQFNFGVPVETYANYINSRIGDITNFPRGIQAMDFYYGYNLEHIVKSNF